MRKNGPSKGGRGVTRRQFIQTSTALAGTALLSPWALTDARAAAETPVVRTAADQVTLGKTGIKLSRLGFGTGSNNGTCADRRWARPASPISSITPTTRASPTSTAPQAYQTFDWIGDAIKGLPREKLFIQSKMPGQPEDVLAVDRPSSQGVQHRLR